MCLTRRCVCASFSRGRFGQVHKCMENSSGLTLAAKIIKAKSQKEKVQSWSANESWIRNRICHWDACFPRQSNGWLLLSLLSTIKDYISKIDTAQQPGGVGRWQFVSPIVCFCPGSPESDVRQVRCPSIALWLQYHLRYTKSSEPTKSPQTQGQVLGWLTLLSVIIRDNTDRVGKSWLSVCLPACLSLCTFWWRRAKEALLLIPSFSLNFLNAPLKSWLTASSFVQFCCELSSINFPLCVLWCVLHVFLSRSLRRWWGMRSRWWTSWTTPTSSSSTPPLSHAMTSSWSWNSKSGYMCVCWCALSVLICQYKKATTVRVLRFVAQCGGRRAVWPHHWWELQPNRTGHGAVYTPDLWRAAVHAQDVHPTSGPQGKPAST